MSENKTITLTTAELETLLERQAEAAAHSVLEKLGLDDEEARNDIKDLRDVLQSWKQIKGGMLRQFGALITTFILGAIAHMVAVKTGVINFTVKP